jgi:hypothetical protein
MGRRKGNDNGTVYGLQAPQGDNTSNLLLKRGRANMAEKKGTKGAV